MKPEATPSWMAEQTAAKSPNKNYNYHTGHANDGRDVQFTQMPNRKGNTTGKTTGQNTASAKELGTRSFHPSAGKNYQGNPDKIQMPQMPNRKGNHC